ncbi:MAG: hypothetical protein KDH15_15700 [Rhodocyclaceae bacterium]|nr:hypothetical protein [Rhodocyclaceae bacterium]
MSKTQTPPAPTPDKKKAKPHDPFAHVGDEHWGKGGSYVIDPASGKRVPVEPAAGPALKPQES